jgi:FMN phosphatase YigB (HAD superfamily)
LLIIFDLDDTLIDTSGCVIPYKLKKVLESMVGFDSDSSLLQSLLDEDALLSGSRAAVESFGAKYNFSAEAIGRGITELNTSLPEDFSVSCTPNAKETLELLGLRATLALVTIGHPSFQMDKLKKAGIEASIFSKISVLESATKKSAYKVIAEEFSLSPDQVWVCGDRVKTDLLPAHELGYKTVHMKWGRGKGVNPEPWVDYTICSLTELKDIIR